MRIRVDMDLCQGHGACVEEAPDVFGLGPDGKVAVLIERPGEFLRDAVRRAVKYCPTRALRLEEDRGGPT